MISVDASVQIVVDLIVTIVTMKTNVNVMSVIVKFAANAPDIWNAKIATLVIVRIAVRRQALMEYIHVKIVV